MFPAICLALLAAQISAAEPRFELADVHASPRSTSIELTGGIKRGGTYQLRHATMLDLVRLAWGVDAQKVLGGPAWLEIDRFDLRAKVPAGTAPAAVPAMLQTLLAERFNLTAHRDTKPVPTWVLTAGKHPVLKPADPTSESRCQSGGTNDQVTMTCRNTPMPALVASLTGLEVWYYLGDNLVADQTGLEGAFDFDLQYSRRWNTTAAGAQILSLFDALEKLGLKLDPSAVPLPVVVVDRVDRWPTPNSPETNKAFPPPPTDFDVAAIKPTDPAHPGEDFRLESERLTIRATTLQTLIADAWGITNEMIVAGPKFLETARWDIAAKAAEEIDPDAVGPTLQTLLKDRFHLAAHFEERTLPAWVLTAPKPRLKKADPASRTGCHEGPPNLAKIDPRNTNPVLGRLLTCTNAPMSWFAAQLPSVASGYIHSEVLDATGLEGGWDFTLSFSKLRQWQGEPPSSPDSPHAPDPNGALSAPEALEKQLGLKLELRKRSVRVLVIDHIDDKPTDN